jgi:anti-sigma factor RsiW
MTLMNQHCSDQDLLLLAHGELSLGRRIVTQAHVAFCLRCQGRLAKLTGASRLLADAIRGRDLPRWSPPGPQGVVAAARTATFLRIGIAILVALSILLTIQAARVFRPPAPQQPVSSGGCRPGLPNDKCR